MNEEGRSAPDAYGDELAEMRAGLRKADANLTEEQLDRLIGFLGDLLKEVDTMLVSTLERLATTLEQRADKDSAGVNAPCLRLAAQIARKTVELY